MGEDKPEQPPRQRMMDYYEELGVDRLASPDEIRQAYKRLVRLLHPDHCRDDALRPLADLQMKRLNGVLRILTNPADREVYDRSVLGLPSPQTLQPMPPAFPLRLGMPSFWPVAGAAALLLVIVLLAYTPPSAPHQLAALEQPNPVVAGPKVVSIKKVADRPAARGLVALPPGLGADRLRTGPLPRESPVPGGDVSPPQALHQPTWRTTLQCLACLRSHRRYRNSLQGICPRQSPRQGALTRHPALS